MSEAKVDIFEKWIQSLGYAVSPVTRYDLLKGWEAACAIQWDQTIARLEGERLKIVEHLEKRIEEEVAKSAQAARELVASREANKVLTADRENFEDELAEELAATRADALQQAANQLCSFCSNGNVPQLRNGELQHWIENEDIWNSCETQDIRSLITPSDAAAREEWIRRIRREALAEYHIAEYIPGAPVPAARAGDAVCGMCKGKGIFHSRELIGAPPVHTEICPSCHGTGKRESK